jgi:hypothetical protein
MVRVVFIGAILPRIVPSTLLIPRMLMSLLVGAVISISIPATLFLFSPLIVSRLDGNLYRHLDNSLLLYNFLLGKLWPEQTVSSIAQHVIRDNVYFNFV